MVMCVECQEVLTKIKGENFHHGHQYFCNDTCLKKYINRNNKPSILNQDRLTKFGFSPRPIRKL